MSQETDKNPDAFRTISEAAREVGVGAHVLRHWEDTFSAVKPLRRRGGRRFYRPTDIQLLLGIKRLLHDHQHTTKGVIQIFKEKGAGHVAEIGRGAPKPNETTSVPQGTVPVPRAALLDLKTRLAAVKGEVRELKEKLDGRSE